VFCAASRAEAIPIAGFRLGAECFAAALLAMTPVGGVLLSHVDALHAAAMGHAAATAECGRDGGMERPIP